MSDRARHPRRIPSILLAVCVAGLLGAASAFAAEELLDTSPSASQDPLDNLAGPPSSRFT